MTCERFLEDSLVDVHFSSLSYLTGSHTKQLNSEDEVGNTGTHAGWESLQTRYACTVECNFLHSFKMIIRNLSFLILMRFFI